MLELYPKGILKQEEIIFYHSWDHKTSFLIHKKKTSYAQKYCLEREEKTILFSTLRGTYT